jgi:hypothetical protein
MVYVFPYKKSVWVYFGGLWMENVVYFMIILVYFVIIWYTLMVNWYLATLPRRASTVHGFSQQFVNAKR